VWESRSLPEAFFVVQNSADSFGSWIKESCHRTRRKAMQR